MWESVNLLTQVLESGRLWTAGPSEMTGTSGWPIPQWEEARRIRNQLRVHYRKGLFSARDLRDLRQGCLSTCCGCMDSTSSSLLHGITPPCPATLAMVLASSLYAESSVHELDWPTCWARKQQKKALKMLRPRGFLGEDLETRPRAERMRKH